VERCLNLVLTMLGPDGRIVCMRVVAQMASDAPQLFSRPTSQADFQKSVQAKQLKRSRGDRRIILAHGDSVQVVRIAPWLGAMLVLFVLAGSLGVIASASYLFFRDELFTASIKRQHQIQVAYEDRVSDLRREIDRITSRQLLNQQAYEARVERLLTEHIQLYEQGARLNVILDRAGSLGLVPRPAPPSPVVPPNQQASLGGRLQLGTMAAEMSQLAPIPADALITGSIPQLPTQRRLTALEQAVVDPASLLTALDESIDAREYNQVVALASVSAEANQEVDAIVDEIGTLGVRLSLPSASIAPLATDAVDENAMGGPLLAPISGASQFELYADDAARALEDLDAVREALDLVPVAIPARNARQTSRFGNRRDPFTRRTAFHSGIDYAAPTGTPVYAPADGVVTRAARRGGYGLMIELDHAHGLSTRFAHLSRMLVSAGTQVRRGDVIGRIGSTGRSTGPHLHYEVHRGGRAIDPLPFVRAGQRISAL
jgi:murein DD-endopeptidase MepM/ murein hydrolase activator NlpD